MCGCKAHQNAQSLCTCVCPEHAGFIKTNATQGLEQTLQAKAERLTPSQELLRYFAYDHLPAKLQAISKPLGDLAKTLDEQLPDGPEKTTGLRKLLEAKDCFVRSALPPAPAYPLIPKSETLAKIDGES